MPKIDWVDDWDDRPRLEPRPRRERALREARERRARLFQMGILAPPTPPIVPDLPVRRPLHLIWGDNDKIVPVEIAETWREALPHARLSVLERCGHLPQVEHPTATAERIQSFIHEARA